MVKMPVNGGALDSQGHRKVPRFGVGAKSKVFQNSFPYRIATALLRIFFTKRGGMVFRFSPGFSGLGTARLPSWENGLPATWSRCVIHQRKNLVRTLPVPFFNNRAGQTSWEDHVVTKLLENEKQIEPSHPFEVHSGIELFMLVQSPSGH